MSQALNYTPHPNFTEGTQVHKQPKYNVPEGEKTWGENFYDWMNYGVIGYGAVLALSLVLTEYFKEGRGRKIWNITHEPFSKCLSRSLPSERAEKVSDTIHKYFYLTSGGTVLMAPILWMENRKSKLTYLANRKWAPETLAADDPYKNTPVSKILDNNFDENRLAQPVNEQPKHGIFNAIWRRALGVATISLLVGPATDRVLGKDTVDKWGIKAGKSLLKSTGSQKLAKVAETKRFQNYAAWTLVDGINTVITSLIIYATSGAGHGKEDDETVPFGNTPKQVTNNTPKPIAIKSDAPLAHIESPKIQANNKVAKTKKLEPTNSYVDSLEEGDQVTDISLDV